MIYSECILLLKIIEQKITTVIDNTNSNKTFEDNEIFNCVLKMILFRIMFVLKWIYNTNVRLNHCFAHFKKFIIVTFKKFNKFNYFIFKIYRPIAFLNTMNKILKFIIIIRLNFIIEKHNLFFRKHFENRKNTFFEHALHYIFKTIHSTWINKKITSILLLNIIETFDNVFHFRLLYTFKNKKSKTII